MKATVIGLGAMGMGAAHSLLRGGVETVGCDVDEEAVARFAAVGGTATTSIEEAVTGARVVMLFLTNAAQIRGILFGSRGAVAAAELGTVFVLNTTMAPTEAEALASDLEAAGMAVVDAPVSGSIEMAQTGALTLMVAGEAGALATAEPVLQAIAAQVFAVGDAPGKAARVKMINQLLAGVHVAAMAEALVLARAEGLDLAEVVPVIGQGTGGSWMFNDRAGQIVEADYSPRTRVDTMVKDLKIATDASAGLDLPLASAALTLFRAASDAGLGSQADAAVAKILSARAGVVLPEG